MPWPPADLDLSMLSMLGIRIAGICIDRHEAARDADLEVVAVLEVGVAVLGADGLKIQRELAWQGEALLGLDPHRLAADGIVIDHPGLHGGGGWQGQRRGPLGVAAVAGAAVDVAREARRPTPAAGDSERSLSTRSPGAIA